jgi:superfamily I DNA/RNA helicase
LQEVGRAGRNKEELNNAGFSLENPIKTKCVLTKDDFRYLQDLNHKGAISWGTIKAVRKSVFEYVSKYQPVVPNHQEPFSLPFDLLSSDTQFDDELDKSGLFRLSLYWLERLGRIRLGLFTPAFIPIKLTEEHANYNNIQDLDERMEVISFVGAIKKYKKDKFPDGSAVMVPMPKLRSYSGAKNHFEVFRFLTLAQRTKAISVERYLNLEPTELRAAELEKWSAFTSSPIKEAVFVLAEKILNSSRIGSQVRFSGDYLDKLILETADECFSPEKIIWKEFKKKSNNLIPAQNIAEGLKKDFVTKRAKFAFKLITMLPKMRHQTIIEESFGRAKGEIINLIYNGNKEKEDWLRPFKKFKTDTNRFIYHIARNFFNSGKKSVNYTDLIIHLNLEDESFDYLPNLLFISKGLGYLKGSGSLIPMGVELFIDDTSDINEKDRSTQDYKTYQDFQEGTQLKDLRLLALECLGDMSKIKSGELLSREILAKQDSFIKKYFTCSNTSELIGLLEEHFGEDHPNLKAFRKEALLREEAKLNDQQRKVYDAPLDENLQVIAGPGSGKTHTLTLRVARLIQNEQISPEQILILAYNRAVVVELKDRLTKLFKELGYAKLISRLKVFTFYGFCKYCLESELADKEFNEWLPLFIKTIDVSPGKINQKLGSIKYVFVDEFQDITINRLELLKRVAHPERANICVIGDPNQSIYGYDRVNEGGAMSSKPYYESFDGIYKPSQLFLTRNYRSLPKILESAENLLKRNTPEFKIPKLIADRTSTIERNYCEVVNRREQKIDWRDKLKELLEDEYEIGKKYQQVAIMYRRNEEVFRAFNELQNLHLTGVRIRIQGASSSPFRSREFFHFLHIFREKSKNRISISFISEFEIEKNYITTRYNNWDAYLINLLHCILIEFLVEKSDDSTYQDLIDFIEDLTNRDEGHYAKIFDKHINAIDKNAAVREIVITTMHKVKGIEFDAVIIPPSFSDFPIKEELDPDKLKELVEEERRLLYVAYTRARYRLVVLKYDKELAIDDGRSYSVPAKIKEQLGIVIPPEIDKFYISWGAKEFNFNKYFRFVEENVKLGDPITLNKETISHNGKTWHEWNVGINSTRVGRLVSGVIKNDTLSKLSGYTVTGVMRYTYEETVEYDKPKLDRTPPKKQTDFAKHWCEAAKQRGYIYLVEFSGYGK